MIYVLLVFNTVAALFYFALGALILWRNPGASLNRAAAGVLACFGVWSASMLVLGIPGLDLRTYRFLGLSSGIGWIWYNTFSLWFVLAFVGRAHLLRRTAIVLPIILLPLLFQFLLVGGVLFGAAEVGRWGYRATWSGSPWVAVWFVYNYAAFGTVLVLLGRRIRSAPDRTVRTQAHILFWSSLICQIAGGLSEIWVQKGIIPHVNHLTTLLWAAALAYAVARHRLFRLTAVTAAGEIVDAMSDFLFLVDLQGTIVSANPSACALAGKSPAELSGTPLGNLFPTDGSRASVEELVAARTNVSGRDVVIQDSAGRRVPVSISFSPVKGPEGGLAGLVCVGRDLTERKRAEELLRRSNEELGRFVRIGSHNLQEPLRNVASFLEMLQKRYGGRLDPTADEYIGFAVDGAVWMKRLVTDLTDYLDISQRPLHCAPVNCSMLVDRVRENLAVPLARGDAVILAQDLPTVDGDGDLLLRLFQELAGNAVKFRSDRPPAIAIAARPAGLSEVPDGAAGAWWHFSVSDNGIGIDKQYLGRIFEVFEKLHPQRQYQGTGIGLAVSRKIVERHGGRIWAESRPGQGATFHVVLPQAGPSR